MTVECEWCEAQVDEDRVKVVETPHGKVGVCGCDWYV
jgi:hypothetical protein